MWAPRGRNGRAPLSMQRLTTQRYVAVATSTRRHHSEVEELERARALADSAEARAAVAVASATTQLQNELELWRHQDCRQPNARATRFGRRHAGCLAALLALATTPPRGEVRRIDDTSASAAERCDNRQKHTVGRRAVAQPLRGALATWNAALSPGRGRVSANNFSFRLRFFVRSVPNQCPTCRRAALRALDTWSSELVYCAGRESAS